MRKVEEPGSRPAVSIGRSFASLTLCDLSIQADELPVSKFYLEVIQNKER